MKIDWELLEEKIEEGKHKIESYPLESTVGTKKMIAQYRVQARKERNLYAREQIVTFEKYQEGLYQELEVRMNQLFPTDPSESFRKEAEKLARLERAIRFLKPLDSMSDKLGFKKIICSLNDEDHIDLEKVNTLLKTALDHFQAMKIKVTVQDFDYSMFTRRYMEVFFENMDKVDFQETMRRTFESIYWECPNLITHLRLNLRHILDKDEKQLENYCKSEWNKFCQENGTTEDTCLESYRTTRKQYERKRKSNAYFNLQQFLNGDKEIENFMPSSMRNSKYNQFLPAGQEFERLSEEQKKNFYENMISLSKILEELNDYYIFEQIIQDAIDRYKKKDTFKGVYSTTVKELSKEEKVREKLLAKYDKACKKRFFRGDSKKKTNLIKVQINDQIKKLAELHDRLDDARFNEKLSLSLNDGSTLREVITICDFSYIHLRRFLERQYGNTQQYDIDNLLERFFQFCYAPSNTFTKRIHILSDANIPDLICEKYRLLNLQLDKESLTPTTIASTREIVEDILTPYYISEGKLSLEDMKFICEVKKLKTSARNMV